MTCTRQLLRGDPQQIEWRRLLVLELSSKGYQQSDIARNIGLTEDVIQF